MAAAGEPRLPRPAPIGGGAWEASATLGGGFMSLDGAPLALGEVRHALAGGQIGRVPWDLRVGGTAELDGDAAFRYGEAVRVGLGGASGFGGVAGVAFGGAPGWSEPELMGRWQRTTRTITAQVTAGAVGRTEEGRVAPGAGGDAELEWRVAPAFRTGAWTSARAWAGAAVPAVTATGGLFVTGLPRADLPITVALGARGATAHDDPAAVWSGLPAPGAADVWAVLRAGWSPRGAFGLVGEGGGVWPVAGESIAYGWATLGVEVHVGRIGAPAVAPGLPSFRVRAVGAGAVAVAGSFNGWVPEALHRSAADPDVWELDRLLPPGTHEYVYLVDGRPLVPPEAARRVDDGLGGENGVLDVR